MRKVALALPLALAGCGASFPEEDPVKFAPGEPPVCELKPNAPAEAREAIARVTERVDKLTRDRAAWRAALTKFSHDLGLREVDEPVLRDAIDEKLSSFLSRGCAVKCERAAGSFHCGAVKVECKTDPAAAAEASHFAEVMNRDLAELAAAGGPERPDFAKELPDKQLLARYSGLDPLASRYYSCDLNFVTSRWDSKVGITLGQIDHVVQQSESKSIANGCPQSMPACRALCKAGDDSACALALIDKTLSPQDAFDINARLCLKKTPATSFRCVFGVKLAETDPSLRDKAAALADQICADSPPSAACALTLQNLGQRGWFREKPLYARIGAALPDQCQAMGADCATLVFGYRDWGDWMDGPDKTARPGEWRIEAPTRKRIAATLKDRCDQGDAVTCSMLGAYLYDLDKPLDEAARGVELERGCELKADQCWTVAACYGDGKCPGLALDPVKAHRANERLCDDYKKRFPSLPPESNSACKKLQ